MSIEMCLTVDTRTHIHMLNSQLSNIPVNKYYCYIIQVCRNPQIFINSTVQACKPVTRMDKVGYLQKRQQQS